MTDTGISGDIFPATMTAPETTQPQPTQPEPLPPAAQKVVLGNKVFNTTEEALAYADGMAQSQMKATASMIREEEPAVPVIQPKRPGQLIFEDPDQALADVETRALERMRAEQRAVDEKKKFWDDFYLKHSDLKGSELLVDAVLGKEQAEGRFRVNWNQAYEQAPILAAKARQEVAKIRNVPSGGQALPSNPAMVAGASGASTPKAPVSQPAATDFVSELLARRKRG